VCCSVLQCVKVCVGALRRVASVLRVCCRCVAVMMAVDVQRRCTCLGVLQVFRSVLQGVTGVLQYMAGVMLCIAVCYGVLRCVAVQCSVLQCVAVQCSVLQYVVV